jgi:prepilin-type N-terminal cleavage/methylation domain-containing protein
MRDQRLQSTRKVVPIEWVDCAWAPPLMVRLSSSVRTAGFQPRFNRMRNANREARKVIQMSPMSRDGECNSWWLGRLATNSNTTVLSTFPLALMKKPTSSRAARRGFTLIELLVVISIIAILAAMLLPVISKIRTRAAVTAAQTEISQIKSAIDRYESTYSALPASRSALNAAAGEDYTYGTTGAYPAPSTVPPLNVPIVSGTTPYQTNNAEIIAILMDMEKYPDGRDTVNIGHVKNTQRTSLLNAKLVGDATSSGVGLDGCYRDRWKNPYFITMDLNSDEKCKDAFYRLSKVSGLTPAGTAGHFGLVNTKGLPDQFEHTGHVMVWSAGPDGKVDPNAAANTGVNKDNILSWK